MLFGTVSGRGDRELHDCEYRDAMESATVHAEGAPWWFPPASCAWLNEVEGKLADREADSVGESVPYWFGSSAEELLERAWTRCSNLPSRRLIELTMVLVASAILSSCFC
jgi:hypothetical protein